jgi:hypothetical protein
VTGVRTSKANSPVAVSVLCMVTDPACQSYGQPYNVREPALFSEECEPGHYFCRQQ